MEKKRAMAQIGNIHRIAGHEDAYLDSEENEKQVDTGSRINGTPHLTFLLYGPHGLWQR